MRVVAGEDDWTGQKEFVRNICSLANDLQMHAHIVHHARKGDESQPLSRAQSRGSVSITDQTDNLLGIQVNRDDNVISGSGIGVITKPNASISVLKQRNGEYEGVIPLYLDATSTQFRTATDASMLNLMQWCPLTAIERKQHAVMH